MQPLKIVALVMGVLPIAAFILTLYLTGGAPLQPFAAEPSTSGEESGSAAVIRELPRGEQERQGGFAAADFAAYENDLISSAAEAGLVADAEVEIPAGIIDRNAELFITLFGRPQRQPGAAR